MILYVGPKENTAGLVVTIKSNTLLDLASCNRKEKYIFTHPLPVYIWSEATSVSCNQIRCFNIRLYSNPEGMGWFVYNESRKSMLEQKLLILVNHK